MKFYICTVSDHLLINPDKDRVKPFLKNFFGARKIEYSYEIVPNEKYEILRAVSTAVNKYEVILVLGGTGIGDTDLTVEALRPVIDKELHGFGEVLRSLSYKDVGPKALLSRAFAGRMGSSLVFVLPGNPSAIKLVLDKVIVPLAEHGIEVIKGKLEWGDVFSSVVERIDENVLKGLFVRVWRDKRPATGIYIGKVKFQVNSRRVLYMENIIEQRDLEEISNKVAKEYNVNVTTIAARGKLKPGEPIFIAVISATNRNTVNRALRKIVELYKERVYHRDIFIS